MVDSLDNRTERHKSLPVVDSSEQRTPLVQSENGQLTYDALVLDAGLRQSLTTVRSLGSRGLRVAALGATGKELTFSSRWCQQAYVCSASDGTDEYLNFLERALELGGARVLMTSSDATIALIRRHRERLERRVSLVLAKEPALAIAINKEQTLGVARRLGIHIPAAARVETASEVSAAVRDVGLPAVVKPVESWVGDEQRGVRLASRLVTTHDEAQRAVEELTRFGTATLFQQFLSGRRESLTPAVVGVRAPIDGARLNGSVDELDDGVVLELEKLRSVGARRDRNLLLGTALVQQAIDRARSQVSPHQMSLGIDRDIVRLAANYRQHLQRAGRLDGGGVRRPRQRRKQQT